MNPSSVRTSAPATVGPLQIGIILLAAAAGIIHLVVLNALMLSNPEFGRIDPLFTLNGLGFLALLAGLYLPIPFLQERRTLVRYLLIGYTLVTILAWLILGRPYSPLGIITAAIEAALVVLLLIENRRS